MMHVYCYKFKFKGFKKVVAKCACTKFILLVLCYSAGSFVPSSADMEDKSGLTEHEWDLEFHG